jgi:hypothetical protein
MGVTAMGVDEIHFGIIVPPGQQFRVRAAMFRRLKAAFDADGIRFSDQTRTRTTCLSGRIVRRTILASNPPLIYQSRSHRIIWDCVRRGRY